MQNVFRTVYRIEFQTADVVAFVRIAHVVFCIADEIIRMLDSVQDRRLSDDDLAVLDRKAGRQKCRLSVTSALMETQQIPDAVIVDIADDRVGRSQINSNLHVP